MPAESSKPPFYPVNLVIFVALPLLALIAVPWWGFTVGFSGAQWLWAVIFLYLNGLAITGGYHRLWAHRAYEAHPCLRVWLALWGAGALQNSILVWASDHRRHHRHVDDNERDPYSAGRGIWFSHMGWMLRDYATNQEDFSNARDLERDPVVMWQHRHYIALTTLMNLGLPVLLGVALGDVIGTVLLVGLLRLVVNHHVTFLINSLAHVWGSRPYTESNSARDNGFLAFLTYGEGYHNYHHIFQNDYRNGIRWYQWDPTKWMIRLCAWLGLAKGLVTTPDFRIQRAILDTQFERARRSLGNAQSEHPLLDRLEKEYQLFTESINRWKALQAERYEKRVSALEDAFGEHRAALQQRWEQAALRTQLRELEFALKMQRKRLALLMQQLPAPGAA
jgi:stearoyl-CoA desaturase (delta-9 desaturase)